jgi:hypothetical protein
MDTSEDPVVHSAPIILPIPTPHKNDPLHVYTTAAYLSSANLIFSKQPFLGYPWTPAWPTLERIDSGKQALHIPAR